MKAILSAIISMALCAVLWGAQDSRSPEVQLKAAIHQEEVKGDLKGSIEAYKKIAEGSNRAVAAQALIRMGQCYQKLGDAEATKAYERVVREFADQKEAVAQARALLAANGKARQPETGLTVQQKWVLPAGQRVIMSHVSPDGRFIPYETGTTSWLHDLTTGENRKVIDRQAGAWGRSFKLSPDGKQIAYTWMTRKSGYSTFSFELRVAGIDGSYPRPLVDHGERWLWPLAWSPDAKHILIGRQNTTADISLALVAIADNSVRVLTTHDDYSNGCFSPDGKYIVTYRIPLGGYQPELPPGGFKLKPVDGSKEVVLFESAARNWYPFWTPDGRKILFLSDRSGSTGLWSIRVSGGRPDGEPELVKREVGPIDVDPIGFARDGTFYYKTTIFQDDIYAADLDPATGRVISKPELVNQRFVGSVGYSIAWSPDGQFLAYTRTSSHVQSGVSGPRVISLIVRSERTGEEHEVILVPRFNHIFNQPRKLQWFPDGRSLLGTDYVKKVILRQIDVQTGQAKVFLDLSDSGKDAGQPNLSHDGKELFYVQIGGAWRVMRRNTESGEEKELYQKTGQVGLGYLSLSADERQLAFVIEDEQKTYSLMIMPAEGGNPRELLRSKLYINDISWTRDGRHILISRGSESGPPQLQSVSIDGGEPQPSGLAMPGMFSLTVRPDGRRMAFYSSKEPHEEVWAIRNLLSTPKPSRQSSK